MATTSKGKRCARCGADEFRVNGYCSVECEDLAEREDEIKTLKLAGDQLFNALHDVEFGDYDSVNDVHDCPSCGCMQPSHNEGCALAAAMEEWSKLRGSHIA